MELNDYQKAAMTTCMDSSRNIAYMQLNSQGEGGEFASKLAKAIRKGWAMINKNKLEYLCSDLEKKNLEIELKKELGDELWQLAGKCEVMGWSLQDVADLNLLKLKVRKQKGRIDGNGDNR